MRCPGARAAQSSRGLSHAAFRIFTAGRRGFSIVEMVVVMLFISILVVLAIEKTAAVISTTRARLAANELSVNLRHIRNMAMERERTTRVTFSVAANAYAVSIGDTNAIGGYAPAVNPATQLPWSNRFSGVELADVNIGGGDTVYFHGTNGIPLINTGGTRLETAGSIVFDSGATVTIVPDTGYINWHRE